MGYPMHGKSVSVVEERCQYAVPVAKLSDGPFESLWWTDPCLKQISWLPRLYRELFASQWYRKGSTPQAIGSSILSNDVRFDTQDH